MARTTSAMSSGSTGVGTRLASYSARAEATDAAQRGDAGGAIVARAGAAQAIDALISSSPV